MSNSEILKKAIKKAEKNGWICPFLEKETLTFSLPLRYGKNNSITLWRNGLIFSHSFAKAFWSDDTEGKMILDEYGSVKITDPWRYHLMWMAFQEEPLKYLEKFL